MTETETLDSLARKLHPRRYSDMSGRMTAILGTILGQKWTEPAIAELTLTSDDGLLARQEGDIGFNDFIGSGEDLRRNIRNLLDVAELTEEEAETFRRLYREAGLGGF